MQETVKYVFDFRLRSVLLNILVHLDECVVKIVEDKCKELRPFDSREGCDVDAVDRQDGIHRLLVVDAELVEDLRVTPAKDSGVLPHQLVDDLEQLFEHGVNVAFTHLIQHRPNLLRRFLNIHLRFFFARRGGLLRHFIFSAFLRILF